ncbi:hypothetical protein [Roseibium sp. MB-4]
MKTLLSLVVFFAVSFPAFAEQPLSASAARKMAHDLDKRISMTGNYGLKWENGGPQQTDRVALVRASSSMIFATHEFLEAWALDRLANRDSPASDESELDKYSTCAFASMELSKYVLAFVGDPSFAAFEDESYSKFVTYIQYCRAALDEPIE